MIWFLYPLGLKFESHREQDLQDWLLKFVAEEPIKIELLAVVAHGIWMNRNKLVFEDKKIKHLVQMAKATSILYAYQSANLCSLN